MSKVSLTCYFCDKLFSRVTSEYNRSKAKNARVFCSISCSAKGRVSQPLSARQIEWSNSLENVQRLRERNSLGLKADEFTPFKELFRRSRRRKSVVGIDLCFLRDLWNKQEGKCAYTQIPLILPNPHLLTITNPIYAASLDRIDSSQGYVEGNLQYVSMVVNFAKNKFSDQVMREFLSLVKS